MKKFFSYSFIIFTFFSIVGINAQVSLREKIGQMVWTSFSGTKLHDTTKYDLQKRNMGGVILFAGSISNPSQVKLLNDTIKIFANTPPFIAVDQEGGRVARLNSNNGFANSYTAYQLGTVFNKEDSTRKSASTMASWLSQSGFNVNLAPVADVNVNPNSPAIGKLERSYSQNPDLVYQHTRWFVDEFNKKNIITCLKHFPGHGSAVQDSHLGFTDITNTWTTSELIPYQSLIGGGYNNLVMIGHLYNSKLDITYPASLSKKITTDLLRGQLGFNGVIVTDGMFMSAITQNYSFEDAITLAVNAGNDILLYTSALRNGSSLAKQIMDVIEDRTKKGIILANRIDESYNRIIQLKQRFGIVTSTEQYAVENLPTDFKLYQNYPNPFNPSTTISYHIPIAGNVSLKVYDILGREVATLVYEFKPAGNHSTIYTLNSTLSSGVYFYQLRVNKYIETKKMMVLK
jgi:beta-N-acetylhexosaminidase